MFPLTKLLCILAEPRGKVLFALRLLPPEEREGAVSIMRKCNVGAHYPNTWQDETSDLQIGTKSIEFCGLP